MTSMNRGASDEGRRGPAAYAKSTTSIPDLNSGPDQAAIILGYLLFLGFTGAMIVIFAYGHPP